MPIITGPAGIRIRPNSAPALVGGGTFGQLFDTPVDGEVYGQPLVDDGQLLVNTENNYAYGLDPVTGAILWTREFGAPVLATDIGCADLTPTFGVTSTPVVDQSTDVEYLVDNEYVSGDSGPTAYYMHALNLADNGAEEPGFPVEIQGTASNDPSLTFNPSQELQRPGLLLMNGTVYAAFAAHCDIKPWEGWIAGVTETGTLQTMWTTAATSTDASPDAGAGIWMSGGGLVSDGPGQILFATGNGSLQRGRAHPRQHPTARSGRGRRPRGRAAGWFPQSGRFLLAVRRRHPRSERPGFRVRQSRRAPRRVLRYGGHTPPGRRGR